MEISEFFYWLLFLLLIYIITIPVILLLYYWIMHSEPGWLVKDIKKEIGGICFLSLVIALFVMMISLFIGRDFVSRTYTVHKNGDVEEKIKVDLFREEFVIRNLTVDTLYEVAVTYGPPQKIRFGNDNNIRVLNIIEPKETKFITEKPESLMDTIPTKTYVYYRRGWGPSDTEKTFIITEEVFDQL